MKGVLHGRNAVAALKADHGGCLLLRRHTRSPRPKRRGRIEGLLSKPLKYRGRDVLHGRNAVAALKEGQVEHVCRLADRSPRPKRRGRIEGLPVERLPLLVSRSPRPKRRGRIEGGLCWRYRKHGSSSPRPKRRGRIEGSGMPWQMTSFSDVLHGRNAVAALKALVRHSEHSSRVCFPRPKRRGRIEGSSRPARSPSSPSFSTAETPWPH